MRCAAFGLALAFLTLAVKPVSAQPYEISWWTADAGGAMNQTGGPFALGATAGQADAGGPHVGGTYVVHGGFWSILAGGGTVTQADLAMALADAPDPVAPGGTLTYTIVVTNLGPATSTGTTVVDALHGQTTFVSATAGCAHAAGVVTCALGTLGPAAVATVLVQVAVLPSATGTITNTATVGGSAIDPVAANNADTETTRVLPTGPEGELAHGVRIDADLAGLGAAADVDHYRIRLEPYASYEIVVDATSGDIGPGTGPALDRTAADGSTVLQTSQPVGAGPARSLRFANATSSSIDTQLIRVRSASCGSGCGPDDAYRLRAWDTTLAIARFNNSATQVTVLVLQNRDPAPLAGHVRFWSAAGTLLHEAPLSLGARAGLSLNTSTLPPLAGQGGSITVTHDGAQGALAGKAIALEPATGLAFDSFGTTRPR